MLLKSRASPDMLRFRLCNKEILAIRNMYRPLFPTTLSIPSYDIGKWVELRSYQHPFVMPPSNNFFTLLPIFNYIKIQGIYIYLVFV
jgi:hypothetical protein